MRRPPPRKAGREAVRFAAADMEASYFLEGK